MKNTKNVRMVYRLLQKYYGSKTIRIEVREELKKVGISKAHGGRLKNPFENLVMGILSQNTSDRNSARAYIGLKKYLKIFHQRF